MSHSGTHSMHRYAAFFGVIIFFAVVVLCPMSSTAEARSHKKAAVAGETVPIKKGVSEVGAEAVDGGTVPVEAAQKDAAPSKDDAKNAPKENDFYSYEKPSIEEESYAWVIFKTLLVLGILVGGFYYFFRFVSRKTGMAPGSGNAVQVLSLVPLGQNRFLQIIDLAGRVLVLGVTEHAINLITEIKDKDEIDRIRLSGPRSTPMQPGGFQEFLTRQIGRLLSLRRKDGAPPARHFYTESPAEADIDRLEYLAMQRERLKRMNGLDDEK